MCAQASVMLGWMARNGEEVKNRAKSAEGERHSTVRDGVVEWSDGIRHLTPERAQAFLGLVRASDRLERVFTASLRSAHDLTLQSFEVLLFLSAFSPDRQMALADLTKRAPLSQSRMSRLVAELEGRDLLVRHVHPDDGRGVMVTITQKGVDLFHAAQDLHLADLDEHLFSVLTDEEIKQLASITHKILNTSSFPAAT